MLALEWGKHCEMTKVFMKEEFLLLSARRLIRFFMQVSSKEFVLVFFVLASLPSRSVQAKHESDTRRRKKRGKGKQINKQVDGRRNLCDKKNLSHLFLRRFCRSFVSFFLFFGAEDSFREVTYAKFRVVRIMAFCEIGVHKVAALRVVMATMCERGSMVMIIADDYLFDH